MKRWFGPKLFGVGASPASWEGWLVTAAVIVAVLLVARIPGIEPAPKLLADAALVAVYLLVVRLTYRR